MATFKRVPSIKHQKKDIRNCDCVEFFGVCNCGKNREIKLYFGSREQVDRFNELMSKITRI